MQSILLRRLAQNELRRRAHVRPRSAELRGESEQERLFPRAAVVALQPAVRVAERGDGGVREMVATVGARGGELRHPQVRR